MDHARIDGYIIFVIPFCRYFFNHVPQFVERGLNYSCINAAVEESTIADRGEGKLKEHDIFCRDNMREGDILIVSCGGNDIALRPTKSVMVSVGFLYLTPQILLKNDWAPFGKSALRDLFLVGMQSYIERLCSKATPHMVLPCMIYFPCLKGHGWSDGLLNSLSYTEDGTPSQLQEIIRMGYREFTCKIQVPKSSIIAVPLFEILDPLEASDYDNRVEPSINGGGKMGKHFADIVERNQMREKKK